MNPPHHAPTVPPPQLTVAESHGFDEAVSGGHMARAGRGNIVRAGLGVGRAAAAAAGGGAEVGNFNIMIRAC